MNLIKHEQIGKNAKQCIHCRRNTLLPYEYDWTCIACGCIITREENDLSKNSKNKNKFH